MITDRQIDLTIDNKFGRTMPQGRSLTYTLFEDWVFPWDNNNFNYVHKRKYGDHLSDDLQVTVRRSSDGRWWFAGDYSRMKYWKDVFSDYIYEEVGGMRGELTTCCIRCGNMFIAHKTQLVCPYCILSRKSKVKEKFNLGLDK